MKLFDFNMLISNHKGNTKVVVETENDLLLLNSVLTVRQVREMIDEQIRAVCPFGSQNEKKRGKFIDEYEKKVIGALELKN